MINVEMNILANIIEKPQEIESFRIKSDLFSEFIEPIFKRIEFLHLKSRSIGKTSLQKDMSKEIRDKVDSILSLVPSKNTKELLDIIRDDRCHTEITSTFESALSNSMEGLDIEEVTRKSIKKLQNILSQNYSNSSSSSLSELGDIFLKGENLSRFATGINGLDDKLDFDRGDLVIVGGRPSQGKTMLCLNMLLNMGFGFVSEQAAQLDYLEKKPLNVVFFSVEMPVMQIMTRLISTFTNIPLRYVKDKKFTDSEFKKVQEFIKKTKNINIKIVGEINSIEDIYSETMRLNSDIGVDVIFIDHAALVDIKSEKFQSRNYEMGHISKTCKRIAKEINGTSVLLSQLSRKVEERDCKVPLLSDLRESGSLEQDADIILFPFRPHYYSRDQPEDLLELYIAKNRNGCVGKVNLKVDLNIQKVL